MLRDLTSLAPSRRWFVGVWLCALSTYLGPSGVFGNETTTEIVSSTNRPCGPRSQDQVFLVSTRNLDCNASNVAIPNFAISRYEAGCWKATPGYDFAANDREMRTVIYVHGNRVDANFASSGGLTMYRELTKCASDEPVRFIIWSWCSDRIRGPRRDARSKACVADDEVVLFGRFISRFPAEQEIGLMGFSYGSRIISGGLHLVGGGTWQGQQLPRCAPARFHTVLFAAAFDNDWLLPGHAHGCAVRACPHWLIMINPCDEALRYYPRIDGRRGGAEALGYSGIACKSALGEYAAGIRECTVQHLVGDSHQTLSYACSPQVMAEARGVVLGAKAGE